MEGKGRLEGREGGKIRRKEGREGGREGETRYEKRKGKTICENSTYSITF